MRRPDPSPVVAKICLRPLTDPPEFAAKALNVTYEVRPVARLSAGPKASHRPLVGGISVGAGANDYGTLGGVLRDPSGTYGLTCAHVISSGAADQPAQYDGSGQAPIGTVRYSSSLVPSAGSCNPFGEGMINETDAALVQLTTASRLEVLGIGALSGRAPRSALVPGQTVEFAGRSSGQRALVVGGLALTYNFLFRGSKYCFKNLFELRWPSNLNTFLTPPVQPGDSGAWVCAHGPSGSEWCGVVLAEDRFTGYACFSDSVADWWASLGLELEVG